MYNRQGILVGNQCWFTGSHNGFYTYYVQWIMLVFMSIIPFLILIVANSMIIYKMAKYKQNESVCQLKIVPMIPSPWLAVLISISLLFLVTQVPAVIISIFHKTFQNLITGQESLYTFYLVQTISKHLKWSNHAVLLYIWQKISRRNAQGDFFIVFLLSLQERQ